MKDSKIIEKDRLEDVLNNLKERYKVFVPSRDGDYHLFRPLGNGIRADLNYQNSRLSPKGIIYPQSDRMFVYSIDPEEEDAFIMKEAEKDFSPQLIFGIRPCDAHAFNIVKVNFDTPEYKDPWWLKRFNSTLFIGFGCNNPCSTCFCTSVGGGPFHEQYLDVLMYDLGDKYIFSPITDKGRELIEGIEGLDSASESDLKKAKELKQSAEARINGIGEVSLLKDKDTLSLFNAPFWEEVAFSCLNCGTCTFLCPTCWCFDIQDEVYKKEGDRIRNWDSCMFPLFTLHGSGHNPRDKKFQRVRQRFMHKLKYYLDRYGNGIQCSGCGRCVRYCPVNIDIREVFNLMIQI